MKTKFFCLITFLISVTAKAEPLVKLLVNPCNYNGKVISTSGVLGFPSPIVEPNTARLYLSVEDFKYNNFEQSLLVRFEGNKNIDVNNLQSRFVHIEGVFDCTLSSHGKLVAGGFKSIDKVVIATANPNFPNK